LIINHYLASITARRSLTLSSNVTNNLRFFMKPSNKLANCVILIVECRFKNINYFAQLEDDTKCQYDYLQVFDGTLKSSPLLKTMCGANLPEPITSTGNTMALRFVSDNVIQKLGFAATFQKCKFLNFTEAYKTPT
uniref:CUB domain-containing protein n=1 Tax=Schistocephalus solidus TaxID=70667 RepID=A0A183TEC6_SCHSO